VIHLDTSFLIQALHTDSQEGVCLLEWLAGSEPVGVSAIVWAEFLCGPVPDEAVDLARTVLGEPVPLTGAVADEAAALFNGTGRRRGSFVDCLVAASALAAGARLATSNLRDFVRFAERGLELA
jgi:predicted nucleic acid-binding protein